MSTVEKKLSRPGSEPATVEDRTAVPSIIENEKNEKKGDVENQVVIEEQKDGLPAPIEIPDGGVMAWATVTGA